MLSSATSKGVVMNFDMENYIKKINLNSGFLGLKQVPRFAVQVRLYRFLKEGLIVNKITVT